MDIYDLIEALRRQWIPLAVGSVILVALIFLAMFSVDGGSIKPRLAPRYQATSQMVVVSEGIEELTDPLLTSGEFGSVAGVYADLLATERAAAEIGERSDSEILALQISRSSGSPVIKVDAESPSAEEATRAAVGAFEWLETRLLTGGILAGLGVEPVAPPTTVPVDSDRVIVLSEPTFELVDPEVWIEIVGPDGQGFATPLNALESGITFESAVHPDEPIALAVGPEVGEADDELRIIAPINGADQLPPLEVVLRRGAVVFDPDGVPSFNRAAVSLKWGDLIVDVGGEPPPELTGVTVMLLDDQPVAIAIGQRRGPMIAGGALLAGFLALIVFVLMRDTWQQRRTAGAVLPLTDTAEHLPIAQEPAEPEREAEDEADDDDLDPPVDFQPWQYRRAMDQ